MFCTCIVHLKPILVQTVWLQYPSFLRMVALSPQNVVPFRKSNFFLLILAYLAPALQVFLLHLSVVLFCLFFILLIYLLPNHCAFKFVSVFTILIYANCNIIVLFFICIIIILCNRSVIHLCNCDVCLFIYLSYVCLRRGQVRVLLEANTG